MPKPITTLVLGAGASNPYGLPTSADLKKIIIEDTPSPTIHDLHPNDHMNDVLESIQSSIRDMSRAFSRSGQYSIDSFLELRREYEKTGKICAVTYLLEKEAEAASNPTIAGDWYQWLFSHIVKDNIDEFLRHVNIVTFNYDRTLEISLMTMLIHSLKLESDRAESIVNNLPIVHVYGSHSSPIQYRPHLGHFVINYTYSSIVESSKNIRIIDPSHNVITKELEYARTMIGNSSQIVFLGFGFNENNLHRIGVHRDHSDWQKQNTTIIASAFGMSLKEMRQAENVIEKTIQWGNANQKCLEVLRELVTL